jgi:hypothetical protein
MEVTNWFDEWFVESRGVPSKKHRRILSKKAQYLQDEIAG